MMAEENAEEQRKSVDGADTIAFVSLFYNSCVFTFTALQLQDCEPQGAIIYYFFSSL